MIQVLCCLEHNRVVIRGHAGSDVYGKDLICAAVSALAVTLGANVRHMAEFGCVTDAVIRLKPGDTLITCKPKSRYRSSVKQIFMTVCVGFELLAQRYPEYIAYTFRG